MGNKCDYIVLNDDLKTAYLIELKGSHIKSAFVQLENTDKNLREALKEHKVCWRVICSSKSLNLRNNDIKKYKKKHPQLEIGKNILRENI